MSGYTFINGVIERWKDPWLCHQPLMAQLAGPHKVMFVLPEFNVDAVVENIKKHHLPPSGLERYGDAIAELRPSKIFPRVYRSRFVDDLSTRGRAWEIHRNLRGLGWGNDVAILWHPAHADYLPKIKARLKIYHIGDYFPGFHTGEERAKTLEGHHRLIDGADMVLPCSQALFDDAAQRRKNGIHLLENGVDFDLFNKAPSDIPEDMKHIPRPIIAYIGRLNRRVDLNVLTNIARARPKWSVLLLGPTAGWMDEKLLNEFKSLPNVHLIGGKTPQELPRYTKAIDVGLISYKLGVQEYVTYCYPLKMLEYFASGKPVVSVDLPSIRKHQPLVRLVKNDDDWVAAIDEALNNNTPTEQEKRLALARASGWSNQAKILLKLVEERLGKPRG